MTDDAGARPALDAAALAEAAPLTPELVDGIRRRAERRDRRGWEYTTLAVEAVYALLDAAEALDAARREIGGLRSGLAFYKPEAERYQSALVDISNAIQEHRDPLERIAGLVAVALAPQEGATDAK